MQRDSIDEAGIAALVAGFYGRARQDALIGPVFEAAIEDWDHHLARLTDFWSSVTLSTGRYKGNPFGAHRPLPLAPPMFERWLSLWRETAHDVFTPPVAASLIQKAELIASSLRMGLFGLADAKPQT